MQKRGLWTPDKVNVFLTVIIFFSFFSLFLGWFYLQTQILYLKKKNKQKWKQFRKTIERMNENKNFPAIHKVHRKICAFSASLLIHWPDETMFLIIFVKQCCNFGQTVPYCNEKNRCIQAKQYHITEKRWRDVSPRILHPSRKLLFCIFRIEINLIYKSNNE